MKESYDEGLASHIGPESCGYGGNIIFEALTGGSAGRVLSLEIGENSSERRRIPRIRKATPGSSCKVRSTGYSGPQVCASAGWCLVRSVFFSPPLSLLNS